ncbi:MAG: pseudaminic acid cytidylyltransferase [Pseudomonadales bacterium]|nr:pseudaminic acid cytidylyltransferase [Pseudomonadales bacterium]NRA17335.1 pseudaminic acid cytidylyltransferase [Oceanospirillaceae bacterium]
MNIAIIPARGGSKRIPRKNIKVFHGKPMIAYSIEAAITSGCFDRIIVSTDDQEIAEIAKKYGAEIPFLRPAAVSGDFATTVEVIQHATTELQLKDNDILCCLYATAPFVTADALLAGLELLKSDKLDYVFSATEFSFPIQRAFRLSGEGRVEMFQPEFFKTRSQDLECAYHDAGQFYWGNSATFSAGKAFFSDQSKPILIPASRVQDIDTPADWERAELIFKLIQQQNK